MQVRAPQAQKAKLAKLAKVAKLVSQSLDPKTLQWIASVVFGLALQAEYAHGKTTQDESANTRDDSNANDDQTTGEHAQSAVKHRPDSAHAGEHREINLGPHSEILLAQIANAPVDQGLGSLAQIKQFFGSWFEQNPVTHSDPGVSAIDARDQAITQAII